MAASAASNATRCAKRLPAVGASAALKKECSMRLDESSVLVVMASSFRLMCWSQRKRIQRRSRYLAVMFWLKIRSPRFAVLRYLVERAGHLVTDGELLETVCPDTYVQPQAVKSQLCGLRIAPGGQPTPGFARHSAR